MLIFYYRRQKTSPLPQHPRHRKRNRYAVALRDEPSSADGRCETFRLDLHYQIESTGFIESSVYGSTRSPRTED